MRITGVLAPNHTPDDEAVFVDLKTAWIIEGLAHGHQDLADPDAASAVRSREGNVIQANASVVEFNEVTEDNIDSFHFHGDPATYPLSAAILIPDSKKNRALALGEYQSETSTEQIVIPLVAITQLTETLFATRKMILAAFILLGAAALGLAALVFPPLLPSARTGDADLLQDRRERLYHRDPEINRSGHRSLWRHRSRAGLRPHHKVSRLRSSSQTPQLTYVMKSRIVLPLLSLFLVGCGEKKQTTEDSGGGKPTIATVNYPLAYFAERLAGDFATVVFDAPADEDPAFWKPSDEEIARFQDADLILLNGASYAKWTSTTTLPFSTTVDTSASFEVDLIEVVSTVKHKHGKGDDHSHSGTAFTTWMDFKQAGAQASAAANAIIEDWPAKKESVMNNLRALQDDLKSLDSAMSAATAKLKDAPLIASHPVYQYWERAYGLKVPSLLWEPEIELNDEAMADLKKIQDANPGAQFFVWEGDPLPAHLEQLKAAGLTCVVVSPCGNRPEKGDFLSVMQNNIAALEGLAQ